MEVYYEKGDDEGEEGMEDAGCEDCDGGAVGRALGGGGFEGCGGGKEEEEEEESEKDMCQFSARYVSINGGGGIHYGET